MDDLIKKKSEESKFREYLPLDLFFSKVRTVKREHMNAKFDQKKHITIEEFNVTTHQIMTSLRPISKMINPKNL